MLKHRSFAEILEGKANKNPTVDLSAGWESQLDPSGLAHLLGELDHYNFTARSQYMRYPKTVRAPHIMCEAQQSAYTVLNTYKQSFKNNFNLTDLKSAYRTAVLKAHPDQGGSAESFQVVKKSYEILLGLVNK